MESAWDFFGNVVPRMLITDGTIQGVQELLGDELGLRIPGVSDPKGAILVSSTFATVFFFKLGLTIVVKYRYHPFNLG